MLNAEEFARDDVVQRNHDRHEEDGGKQALDTSAHEQHEVQLEAEQNDASAQELVRDERRRRPRRIAQAARALERHAEEQRKHKRADEREPRQLRELLARERARERHKQTDGREAAAGNHTKHLHGCVPPFHALSIREEHPSVKYVVSMESIGIYLCNKTKESLPLEGGGPRSGGGSSRML